MDRPKLRCLIALTASVLALWLPLSLAAEPEEPLTLTAHPVQRTTPPISAGDIVQGGEDYRIGQQDLLQITVFGVDDLDQTVRVTDDGSITLPLLGRLAVGGLTKTGLENLIAGMLEAQYMHDPQYYTGIRPVITVHPTPPGK